MYVFCLLCSATSDEVILILERIQFHNLCVFAWEYVVPYFQQILLGQLSCTLGIPADVGQMRHIWLFCFQDIIHVLYLPPQRFTFLFQFVVKMPEILLLANCFISFHQSLITIQPCTLQNQSIEITFQARQPIGLCNPTVCGQWGHPVPDRRKTLLILDRAAQKLNHVPFVLWLARFPFLQVLKRFIAWKHPNSFSCRPCFLFLFEWRPTHSLSKPISICAAN